MKEGEGGSQRALEQPGPRPWRNAEAATPLRTIAATGGGS